jgi:hypothetical protein
MRFSLFIQTSFHRIIGSMTNNKMLLLHLALLLLILSACRPKTPISSQNAISAAIASTLAALPQPTIQPTYTPYPTVTPHAPPLQGLFCEYEFCVGHAPDTAFFDARDSKNPSVYSEGMLATYRSDLFTLIIWQLNHGSDDPQLMLDLIMEEGLDTRRGNLDVNLLGDLTTFYTPITTTATEILPAGGAAAWVCGDRAFGWKVYTASEEIASQLFAETIKKFRCNQ